MEPVVVDRLVVEHGPLRAVDGVSFSAAAGQVTALLGPNGAGKTSTVEVLEGYGPPTSGTVRVLGVDPAAAPSAVMQRIGVMLQDGGVYPAIRPPEMLRLLAAMYDDPIDPDDLLERVGLDDRRGTSWRQLSGGEQQRLSLAMALIGRPEVAFLDEPTSGVDVRGRQVIRDLIRALAADGCAVLLCTHELDEAEKLADRVVILDRGRVVADGSLAELRTATGGLVRFSVADPSRLDEAARDRLAASLGTAVRPSAEGDFEVEAGDVEVTAALTAWLAAEGHVLGDLRAGRHRLEDVFLALTADADTPDDRRADPQSRRPRRRRGRPRSGAA